MSGHGRREGLGAGSAEPQVLPIPTFGDVLRKLLGKWRRRQRKPEKELLVPARARTGLAKIAVAGLGLRYSNNDVEALKDLAFDVHSGEFICLLGPSGCGKTSLLYALAGTFMPSSGKISIDGVPIRGPSPDRLLMFQEPALFPWLTVRQNLVFALGSKPLRRAERERIAREYIQLVKLDGVENYLPHQLSGGMRMRVSLARALAMDPSVLLMDEPFGALDAQTRAEMHVLLQQIWLRSRKTVVFVTHNIREALVLGDRVVVMATKPGRILRDVEVRLERPRDPDDERLVRLSRQIRDWLQAEGFHAVAGAGDGEDVRAEPVGAPPGSVPADPGGALGSGL